jgi:hypothetical protein
LTSLSLAFPDGETNKKASIMTPIETVLFMFIKV